MDDNPWDDDEQAFLDEWAAADSEAGRLTHVLFENVLDTSPPQPAFDRGVRALLGGIRGGHVDYACFRAVCGWDDLADSLTAEQKHDLWVEALSSTLEPSDDPRGDIELESAVASLDPVDWLAAVAGLVTAGPGADASSETLVRHVVSGAHLGNDVAPDDEPLLATAFDVVLPRWQLLGVVDGDVRLTALGAWGLPQALHELWCDGDAEPLDQRLLALGAEGARRDWAKEPNAWTTQLYTEAAAMLNALAENPLVVDLIGEPGWQPFLERVYAETGAAAPAFLLAIRAEWAGDTAAQSSWIAAALAADPHHREALQTAASEAGDRGDAVAGRDLLRRAGLDVTDPEMATYTRFAQPATGGTSRNAPCPCGSAKKFKLCCGNRIGHPLQARSGWLYDKLARFAQQPPQRASLIEWAGRVHGEDAKPEKLIHAAMAEPIVTDAALYDGGLLVRFLDVRGPLLPTDEADLVEQWRATRRAAYEVVSTRPGAGLTLRDLHTEEVIEVRERTASRALRTGDLLLARILPTGTGAMLGFVMSVPRMQRSRLVATVNDPMALFAWLSQGGQPPQLANTEGHDLVLVEQRWRLSSLGWDRLAADLDVADVDTLHEMYEGSDGMRWIRATLVRQHDEILVTTNSVERANSVAQRLRAVDPDAELISEHRPDPSALRAVPDPMELTPELQEAMEQLLRQHEQRWVDESIPMFGGRTPREMVRSAAGRQQVEDFLADVDAGPAGLPGASKMDAGRIRELLGLPTRVR